MTQTTIRSGDPGALAPAVTMSRDEALAEAFRCLRCWEAPCTRACPTSIDVPGFIKQIAYDDMTGSARTILDANILGASCARVCPTEVLCEGACVLNDLHERPIEIGRLQAYATDPVVFGGAPMFTPGPATGASVGVIGAGPAGLSCAAELARRGHSAIVYEAAHEPGGLNTFGVARYKMDKATSLAEVAFVEAMGVEIRCDSPVGTEVPFDDLLEQHDAVFVGVGLAGVPPLGFEGEGLSGVGDALDFIAEVRSAGRDLSGERVAVVGGGNTAIDASTQAAMSGADRVYLVYRRGRDDMRAYPHDIERALKAGVEFIHWALPVQAEGEGSVSRLMCERTEYDADGSLVTIEGTDFALPVTMVLRATGQAKRTGLLGELAGVELDEHGRVIVDDEFRTGNADVWAGGDCVNGGKEVVNAVAHGKSAATSIDRTLREPAAGK